MDHKNVSGEFVMFLAEKNLQNVCWFALLIEKLLKNVKLNETYG